MVIFRSEADLLAELARHDELVRRCVIGDLDFWRFCDETIAFEILGKVCSDEDALLDSYKQAGRFGSNEAKARLARVAFR